MNILDILAHELPLKKEYIENVVKLLDDGNTIPFIARYRKEMHGSADDTVLRDLEERLTYLRNLVKRKDEVKNAIGKLEKLTDELAAEIDAAETLSAVEDLYRPYKQKRRTRATIAKEKGLEPLALRLLGQTADMITPENEAKPYINEDKGVLSVEDALAGASDIIAEMVSDDANCRRILRENMQKYAQIQVKQAKDEDSVYRMYYDFTSPLSRIRPHQVQAINRGEKEEYLKVSLVVDESRLLPPLIRQYIVPGSSASAFVKTAVEDGFSRLLLPSVENEIRSDLTAEADTAAIRNFALNLRPLLMVPPVKGKVTLGYDPGFRNGCKLAVVDGTGKILDTSVIYPTLPYQKTEESRRILKNLIQKHHIEHIAIGNGTASRESEKFVKELLADIPGTSFTIVSEAGASVYSASKLAAEEMPDFDVNLRSAVSIARRLQDPLAELVKIDPKAIGVGQYQHDLPQAQLSHTLEGVVEDCVNAVGVDLNTASPSLLSYVAGLNKTTAKNIVSYREENGIYHTRKDLLKVPKLGPKAFEQCAGFLRIPESKNVLDRTGVHPEGYKAAEMLLKLTGFTLSDVEKRNLSELETRAEAFGIDKLCENCGVGEATLHDMVTELKNPGRDIRDELPTVVLRSDVTEISDLKEGMLLKGTVRNVTDFGVFVDIGVHHDGLVHISQICNKFIRHPSEIVKVGDIVSVVVLEADAKKQKISLSMKQVPNS